MGCAGAERLVKKTPKPRDVMARELLPGDLVLYESKTFLVLRVERAVECLDGPSVVEFLSSRTCKKIRKEFTTFCPYAVLLRGGRIVEGK